MAEGKRSVISFPSNHSSEVSVEGLTPLHRSDKMRVTFRWFVTLDEIDKQVNWLFYRACGAEDKMAMIANMYASISTYSRGMIENSTPPLDPCPAGKKYTLRLVRENNTTPGTAELVELKVDFRNP